MNLFRAVKIMLGKERAGRIFVSFLVGMACGAWLRHLHLSSRSGKDAAPPENTSALLDSLEVDRHTWLRHLRSGFRKKAGLLERGPVGIDGIKCTDGHEGI